MAAVRAVNCTNITFEIFLGRCYNGAGPQKRPLMDAGVELWVITGKLK